MPYDFIGKMETFQTDVEYVLKVIGSDLLFPTNYKKLYNKSSYDLMHSYFAQLPQELVTSLYNMYRLDFEVFGYETSYKPS